MNTDVIMDEETKLKYKMKMLNDKILTFWTKYPIGTWDIQLIKNNFSLEEIFDVFRIYSNILGNDREYYYSNYLIVLFYNEFSKIKGLFSVEEMIFHNPLIFNDEELLYAVLSNLNNEALIEIVKNYKGDIVLEAFRRIDNDIDREKAILGMKRHKDMDEFIVYFDDEEYILKYLKKVRYTYRGTVIADSIEDDYLKEKFLTIFAGDKAELIKSLSTDEKKIYYLKKYNRFLGSYDKMHIISTFSNIDNIMFYYPFLKKEELLEEFVENCSSAKNFDNLINFCKLIKNEEIAYSALRCCCWRYHDDISNEQKNELLGLLHDGRLIADSMELFSDEIRLEYLEKVGQDNRKKIIRTLENPLNKIKALKYLEKFTDIESIIEHMEDFPKYAEEFEYIVDKYSKCYNLNKDNLLYLIKKLDMSVLRMIKNDNLQKIINADKVTFDKVLNLFNESTTLVDSDALNDVLNSFLQREFKVLKSDIIFTFPFLLQAIEMKDAEKINKILNDVIIEMKNEFDVISYFKEKGYNLDQIVDGLLNRNQEIIDLVHNVTTKYVRFKRNEYLQKNLERARDESTKTEFDTKDFMKRLFASYPFDVVMSIYPKVGEKREEAWFIKEGFTTEEIQLLKNRELLELIVKYRMNSRDFENVPLEVKENFGVFNSLNERILELFSYTSYFDVGAKKKHTINKVSNEHIIAILCNLDLDKMNLSILNDDNSYDKLMNMLKKYKVIGWDQSFKTILDNAGLDADPEVISNLIQYYPVIIEELEEKVKNGQLNNVSLTALIDLAYCFASESNKYLYLFGKEDFKLIASNPGPNSSSMKKDERLKKSIETFKTIRNRDYVMVPPIDEDFELKNKKKINVVVGNFSNPMNLTYGERTGACMRIGGAGESLYDFCINNDAGFHIRFSNPVTGKFVSRVSGFRNGNTLFLNQLRSSVDSTYSDYDVYEACKMVAHSLIEMSKKTNSPIDNVVVSGGYAVASRNFQSFKVLDIKKGLGAKDFYTDISESGIVLATSRDDDSLVPVRLGNKFVKRYLVIRDKVKVVYDVQCLERVRHIETMDQVLSGVDIEEVQLHTEEDYILCYYGEDWYIAVTVDSKIEQYVMKNSNNKEKALEEMQSTLKMIDFQLKSRANASVDLGVGK